MVSYELEDLYLGQTFSFETSVSQEDMLKFEEISGDNNPLHQDKTFARERGYRSPVVYGVLLSSYFSRLIGIHLPGKNAVIQMLQSTFIQPVFVGDRLKITGLVRQISSSTRTIVIQATIEDALGGELCVKGKIQVGFTNGSTS